MSVEQVLAQLNPKMRQAINFGSDIQYERQPLPSYSLTRALNGGLPMVGSHSSGVARVPLSHPCACRS